MKTTSLTFVLVTLACFFVNASSLCSSSNNAAFQALAAGNYSSKFKPLGFNPEYVTVLINEWRISEKQGDVLNGQNAAGSTLTMNSNMERLYSSRCSGGITVQSNGLGLVEEDDKPTYKSLESGLSFEMWIELDPLLDNDTSTYQLAGNSDYDEAAHDFGFKVHNSTHFEMIYSVVDPSYNPVMTSILIDRFDDGKLHLLIISFWKVDTRTIGYVVSLDGATPAELAILVDFDVVYPSPDDSYILHFFIKRSGVLEWFSPPNIRLFGAGIHNVYSRFLDPQLQAIYEAGPPNQPPYADSPSSAAIYMTQTNTAAYTVDLSEHIFDMENDPLECDLDTGDFVTITNKSCSSFSFTLNSGATQGDKSIKFVALETENSDGTELLSSLPVPISVKVIAPPTIDTLDNTVFEDLETTNVTITGTNIASARLVAKCATSVIGSFQSGSTSVSFSDTGVSIPLEGNSFSFTPDLNGEEEGFIVFSVVVQNLDTTFEVQEEFNITIKGASSSSSTNFSSSSQVSSSSSDISSQSSTDSSFSSSTGDFSDTESGGVSLMSRSCIFVSILVVVSIFSL